MTDYKKLVTALRKESDLCANNEECLLGCSEMAVIPVMLEEAADTIEELDRGWSAILGRNIQLNTEVEELKAELRRATCGYCPDKGKCEGCNFAEKYGGYDGEN